MVPIEQQRGTGVKNPSPGSFWCELAELKRTVEEYLGEFLVQPIPRGVTFSKAFPQLKAQSSKVSFHRNVAKETSEIRALSFTRALENVTPGELAVQN